MLEESVSSLSSHRVCFNEPMMQLLKLEKNRSELIRTAVEQLLEDMEKKKFETELAAAYVANAQMNIELTKEFAHADSEGF